MLDLSGPLGAFLDLDGRPRVVKHPIGDGMEVTIAAIDPDCE